MKTLRKIIEIDEELCDGCGQCVPSCAEGALEIIDGKAKVISDNLCDGLGACLGECPTGALKVIEREADEFDEEAVEAHLETQAAEKPSEEPVSPCGCPSAAIATFDQPSPCQGANIPQFVDKSESALSHWPIQIRLVPPTAPFLKGADLLVVSDCTPLAYADFHRKFMKGRKVLMGCPKLDDAQSYIDKFAEMFTEADIKSVTTVIMEVPCCAGMPVIVKKGLEKSGKTVPLKEVVISTKGQLLQG